LWGSPAFTVGLPVWSGKGWPLDVFAASCSMSSDLPIPGSPSAIQMVPSAIYGYQYHCTGSGVTSAAHRVSKAGCLGVVGGGGLVLPRVGGVQSGVIRTCACNSWTVWVDQRSLGWCIQSVTSPCSGRSGSCTTLTLVAISYSCRATS